MSERKDEQAVDQHYGCGDLMVAILAGVQAAGKNPDAFAADDLAPVDNFHTRGKPATLELAKRADLKPGIQVLDVGGGIGGAARILASQFGCDVTVLDLTEEYCRTGEALTARTGLSDRVRFKHGSALDIPFPDASFDRAWTQHATMNIADKERLYSEIYRVLRPGGRLAFHEIMAGMVSPIYFPVPWARQQEISFLRPPEAIRTLLKETGFQEVEWVDETAISLAWFQERAATPPTALPPLGLHLLLGADIGTMFQNVARNLAEQRVVVIQGVFERPKL